MIRCVSSIPLLAQVIIISLMAAVGGSQLTKAHAADSEQSPTTVILSVRAIQATAPIERGTNAPEQVSAPQLDADLKDIEGRLINLPFSNFHLLTSKQETITIKQKNSLQLPNGQKLTFRPMYMDQKKVGLWLHWRDKDGSEILNTRVHFDSNESVVTGTDCAHDQGMILAIKAVQVEASK